MMSVALAISATPGLRILRMVSCGTTSSLLHVLMYDLAVNAIIFLAPISAFDQVLLEVTKTYLDVSPIDNTL